MAVDLPDLAAPELAAGLRDAGSPAEPAVVLRLHAHYQALRRAAAGLSLIGAGTVETVVERHYAESLLGRELCPGRGALLEIGSGAGFPGLVLAACWPERPIVLVERRQRKAAFLREAAQAMDLPAVEVVAEDLDSSLSRLPGARIDCIVMRAVRLSSASWRRLSARLGAPVVVHWGGAEAPPVPGYRVVAERAVPGAERRVVRRLEAGSGRRAR